MSTEKLSELSKPVAWLAIYHGDVYDEAISITRSVVESQAERFGWESALTEITPLYSQEYVSALLAELEAKDKRIAELERANTSQDDHINQQQDRIDSLEKTNTGLGRRLGDAEKRLGTPVRLSCETHPRCRTQHAKDVRTAGFTVEGDE